MREVDFQKEFILCIHGRHYYESEEDKKQENDLNVYVLIMSKEEIAHKGQVKLGRIFL